MAGVPSWRSDFDGVCGTGVRGDGGGERDGEWGGVGYPFVVESVAVHVGGLPHEGVADM